MKPDSSVCMLICESLPDVLTLLSITIKATLKILSSIAELFVLSGLLIDSPQLLLFFSSSLFVLIVVCYHSLFHYILHIAVIFHGVPVKSKHCVYLSTCTCSHSMQPVQLASSCKENSMPEYYHHYIFAPRTPPCFYNPPPPLLMKECIRLQKYNSLMK